MRNPEKYSFFKGTTHQPSSPEQDAATQNKPIINQLELLLGIYQNEKDIGRSVAYRKALAQVKACKEPITLQNYSRLLPSIGPKISSKIEEILTTGKLTRTEQIQQSEYNTAIGGWNL